MRVTTAARTSLILLCLVLSACGPHGPTTTVFDGTYQGTGYGTDPGLGCGSGGLTPMRVVGGHADWGNMSGWVQPDGKLTMQFGAIYVWGQFQGTHFQALFRNPNQFCTYRLEMNRVS